ncbi:MAG TPA: GNAT family N-acetyltransferase [Pyrinomonadaceae bacterium]|nr:GNAT family N-acetyltransferase [Pyrinomonadaceae bacterium]
MSIEITEVAADSADAVALIGELDEHLMAHPYPPQSRHAFSIEKLLRERVVFFVTRYEEQLAGCGGIKIFDGDYGEVKRMYVRPEFRGKGLGKAMLGCLSDYARERELSILRLETGIYEVEAIGLYLGFGFERRAPFGEYVEDPLSVYLEKRIRREVLEGR